MTLPLIYALSKAVSKKKKNRNVKTKAKPRKVKEVIEL